MDNLVQTFNDLIKAQLSALNLNTFSAENAAGLPPDAIRNVLRSEKQSGPTLARTKEICDALGLEIIIAPKRQLYGLAEGDSANDLGRTEALRAGYLPMPWLLPSRNGGSAPCAFSRIWLEENHIVPDHMKALIPDVIHLPNFPAKALALIDTSAKQSGPPTTWAFSMADKTHLARAEFMPDVAILHGYHADGSSLLIRSDSADQARFHGRAIWAGGLI